MDNCHWQLYTDCQLNYKDLKSIIAHGLPQWRIFTTSATESKPTGQNVTKKNGFRSSFQCKNKIRLTPLDSQAY